MKELPKDQENLAESFRSYLRKKNMSENTGDAYGRTIRQLLSIYPVPTKSLLRKYRSLLIANYRPATINQRIIIFFFSWRKNSRNSIPTSPVFGSMR